MSEPFRADNARGVQLRAEELRFLQRSVDVHPAEHRALSLLGTFYGGNGTTNFQLPDLRSRTPRGSTNGSNMGDRQGLESVTLLTSQIPQHAHVFGGTTADGSTRIPQGNVLLGKTGTQNVYGASSGAQVPLNVLDASGQTQPHANLQPYLVINFCIALYGIYPSRG